MALPENSDFSGKAMRTISADAQYGSEMTLTESQAEYLVSTERPTEHRGI